MNYKKKETSTLNHRRQLSSLKISRIFCSPYRFLVLIMAFSLFLGGCASSKEMAPAFTPITFDPSNAVVYIYRKSRFVGAANTAEIFINNQHAGQLVNGSYCAYVTDPGLVEIKTLEKIPIVPLPLYIISKLSGIQPLIKFSADPGQEYFLEFNVAGYKVKQVAKDKALGMMSGLKPAKSSAD